MFSARIHDVYRYIHKPTTMKKTTRLYRSNNYPYQNLSEKIELELEKFIDTESGTFLLTLLNDEGDFQLEIPTNQEGKYDTIFDTFNEFQDREVLYKRLDKGVYEFIQNTMEELQTLNVKEKPEGKEFIFTINMEEYRLTLFPTGLCKMEYPERKTEFYIDNIYIENPDLPLLKDGRVAQHFTERVKKALNIDLPKVPYLPMLKIEPKN